MELFKTPNILIINLKRFKNNNKYFQSKINTLVKFPIE